MKSNLQSQPLSSMMTFHNSLIIKSKQFGIKLTKSSLLPLLIKVNYWHIVSVSPKEILDSFSGIDEEELTSIVIIKRTYLEYNKYIKIKVYF